MPPTVVPFYQHDLGQAELNAVAAVLAGPILTTGETVATFEHRFADYLGVQHAVGLTSCTAALHLSLVALGVGPGDEVITTPMTFIATATAIIQAGATPVFADVEADTGLLDPAAVEAAVSPRTRAILPVHLYGQMCDMPAFRSLADRHGLYLIEDAAHCIEGARDGIRPGLLGDTACFSFYATKNMTCGEGGAAVTNDPSLAEKLRLLRQHGMNKTAADRLREGYAHRDMVLHGWKYNMDNLQAAMLLPQMDRLEANASRRQALARRYRARLQSIAEARLPLTRPGTQHAHHLFPVWVEERDAVLAALQRRNIGVVVNYRAIHLLSYFREQCHFRPGQFPNAERIGDRTLSLPFYPTMPPDHVDKTVAMLKESLVQECLAA